MTFARAAAPLLLVLALAGCASSSPADSPSPSASAAASDTAGDAAACEGVAIVVDFGVLDSPSIAVCAEAGAAADALAAANIATEGTVEWGDQVVCRVNDRPAADETVTVEGQEPFTEACQSMPAATAYWALWVKADSAAEWEYAQEGIGTLQLDAGQSVGLVYTAGTESTPPQG